MKVSDYVVEFLISQGISDVFGYPGGMVTHLIDSLGKYKEKISAHVMYHEQGAAFAACGYAQATGKTGVAYATSGPGATNLITGICNAFFDSVPTVFFTGNVNTFESKGDYHVRQRGFQETDVVSMVRGVTKYATNVKHGEDIPEALKRAFEIANSGRKGPVLIDIPMDIWRAEIEMPSTEVESDCYGIYGEYSTKKEIIREHLLRARRPVVLIGNGLEIRTEEEHQLISDLGVPIVSSLPSFYKSKMVENGFGFIGAYGDREANFITAKADLLIALGARLDIRQVGAHRQEFAPKATVIRVDIDEGELEYRLHDDEIQICEDATAVLKAIHDLIIENGRDYSEWIKICNEIKSKLNRMDDREPNMLIHSLSRKINPGVLITTDVGQNQVWIAQSFEVKSGQRFLFSGGHGAMGYSLPAAIGAAVGLKCPVMCFNGDGGVQMNIQELQVLAREKLPITVIILNNNALGMIRHFQEMYFDNRYEQTMPSGGYTVPEFEKIAKAYGLYYNKICREEDIEELDLESYTPKIIEVVLHDDTYVFPKLEYGKLYYNQAPLIDQGLFEYLESL